MESVRGGGADKKKQQKKQQLQFKARYVPEHDDPRK